MTLPPATVASEEAVLSSVMKGELPAVDTAFEVTPSGTCVVLSLAVLMTVSPLPALV